MTSFDQVNHMK